MPKSIHTQYRFSPLAHLTGLMFGFLASSALANPITVTSAEDLSQRLPAHLVKDLHTAFGEHHARAVHTKGVILQGSFSPSPEARNLSQASVFTATVPIIVRFSDFTGIPDIPDTSRSASPRGFAVKFLMPDGTNLDVVNHSFNGFPVTNSADFSILLQAIGASGPGAAKPTVLDNFLATHPIARTFLTTQKAPPESFATATFFGVNSFLFTNTAARSRYVRYRFVPEAGEHYLDDETLKSKPPTYLADEIKARVANRPVRFTWYAQLSGPGDEIENPGVAWPESRELVKLGVLTIDRVASNSAPTDKSLLFLPGSLPLGIGIADPMLTIRNAAYPVSFHQRQ